MARVVRLSDLRTVQSPVGKYPPETPAPEAAAGEHGLPGFVLGQIAAVLSLERSNKLNNKEAVTAIAAILRRYQDKQ